MKNVLITATTAILLTIGAGAFAADGTKSSTAVSGNAVDEVPGKTTVKGGADGATEVPFKSDNPNKVDARNQNNMR